MQAPVFDRMAQDLGTVSTRRGFLRLFGGTAAVAAVAAAGMGESVAAKRKKGKKGKVNGKGKGKGNSTPATPPPSPGGVCSTWILSGGPDQTTPIAVDDDVMIYVAGTTGNRSLIYDNDKLASTITPVVFAADEGEVIKVRATDWDTACRSVSPLWLHCATTGQKRQLFAGQDDGCVSGRTAGLFFDKVFGIAL